MSTVPPVPEASLTLEAILSRSWRLFRDNPITALPIAALTLIALVIIVSVAALFAVILVQGHLASLQAAQAGSGRAEALPAWFVPLIFGAWLGAVVLGCFVQAWIYTVTYGLANAQWATGSATLADGFVAGRKRIGAVFVAGIGFVGLGMAALILALPTLFLSFLALVLFTMYALPAAVGGERPGFAALRESFELVRHAFGTSAIALLILWAIQQGISLLAIPFILPLQFGFMLSAANNDKVPHVELWQIALGCGGYVLIIGASCAYLGYMAIVQTGLYHMLRARAEGVIAAPSTPATPATPQP